MNFNLKIKNLINSINSDKQNNKSDLRFPLLEDGFTDEDIYHALEVLISKNITMSEITRKFEQRFADYVGAKYAVMVNSGSSANLLAAFALTNPYKKNNLKF